MTFYKTIFGGVIGSIFTVVSTIIIGNYFPEKKYYFGDARKNAALEKFLIICVD
jgi:hypothetical protein